MNRKNLKEWSGEWTHEKAPPIRPVPNTPLFIWNCSICLFQQDHVDCVHLVVSATCQDQKHARVVEQVLKVHTWRMDANIVSIQNSPTETVLFVRPASFQRWHVSTSTFYSWNQNITHYMVKLPSWPVPTKLPRVKFWPVPAKLTRVKFWPENRLVSQG